MPKHKIAFTGCGTALVTPFVSEDGPVDEAALRRLVDAQIKGGVDFLVPCGTTGESPTLSHAEHRRVIDIVIEQSAARVPVVAGTGSNSTAEAIELTQHAKEAGAKGCLVVAPYYNKPTQEGLYRHYMKIADVGLPVIVYNIPGRTGVNILPETMGRITKHPNIVGIKEATGNLEQMTQDVLICGRETSYLSGDDTLTLPHMSVGGQGVISVVSNLLPEATVEMIHAARNGRVHEARVMHMRLFPLCKAMFLETNPMPIKAAMAMMGMLKPAWRLPMLMPTQATIAAVRAEMERFGLTITHPM